MTDMSREQRKLNAIANEIKRYESWSPSILKRLTGTNIVYKLSDFMGPTLNEQRKFHESNVKGRFLGFAVLGPLNVFAFMLLFKKSPELVKRIGAFAVAVGSWRLFVQPHLAKSIEFSDQLIEKGFFEHFKEYKAIFDASPEHAIRPKLDLEHLAVGMKKEDSSEAPIPIRASDSTIPENANSSK